MTETVMPPMSNNIFTCSARRVIFFYKIRKLIKTKYGIYIKYKATCRCKLERWEFMEEYELEGDVR